jgi:hypothetical protein
MRQRVSLWRVLYAFPLYVASVVIMLYFLMQRPTGLPPQTEEIPPALAYAINLVVLLPAPLIALLVIYVFRLRGWAADLAICFFIAVALVTQYLLD